MQIFSATKTKEATLQKKRNIFGLGVTSLIAACSAATDNDVAAKYVKPSPGPVGTIPTANFKLGALGSDDDNNAGITVTAEASAMGDPAGRQSDFNDLGISINLLTNPVLGNGNTVTFSIKNGNHETNAVSKSLYTVVNPDKYDLVVSSSKFGNVAGDELTGGVYIYWDIAESINSAAGTIATTNHLEVKGAGNDAIAQNVPEFFQLGGSASAQYDMIVRSDIEGSAGAIYILWDVAAYAGANKDAASKTVDFANPTSATHGLLAIKGASAGDNIGGTYVDMVKINNNNDYDMIIRSHSNDNSATDMYILWDVANYYSTTAPAEISLTNLSATNGLLTIYGRGGLNIGSTTGGSFLDINDKGINDIALSGGGITFVLFGEQLAYRDKDGKAVSDAVNLTEITKAFTAAGTDAGFFTYDKVITPTTKAELAGAIGYRFNRAWENVNTVKTSYADVIDDLKLPPALSDADAGVGVWDIA